RILGHALPPLLVRGDPPVQVVRVEVSRFAVTDTVGPQRRRSSAHVERLAAPLVYLLRTPHGDLDHQWVVFSWHIRALVDRKLAGRQPAGFDLPDHSHLPPPLRPAAQVEASPRAAQAERNHQAAAVVTLKSP